VATFLYRLGRLAFRRRWTVALMWLATMAAVVFAASQAPGTSDERFSMPGIEAQQADDLAEERFAGATADGATARVVFVAPDGQKVTASANRAAIEKTVTELADGPQVDSADDPFQTESIKTESIKDATVEEPFTAIRTSRDRPVPPIQRAMARASDQPRRPAPRSGSGQAPCGEGIGGGFGGARARFDGDSK
jgi:RND superfamily putative drug exporter